MTSAAFGVTAKVETALQGNWKLVGLTCNGKSQTIDKTYTLSFEGAEGKYVSKTSACTQVEPETYQYLKTNQVAIKSGVRTCAPNPCEADLPATECGKEANPKTAIFDVTVAGTDKLTLSTNDPNSVDCMGPGQSKPAVFKFEKLAGAKKTR